MTTPSFGVTLLENKVCVPVSSRSDVPNLSLTMYPFSISTDEHAPLKFLMTKKLSEISKSTEVSTWLLCVRIFGNKYIFPLNVPLQIGKYARTQVGNHWSRLTLQLLIWRSYRQHRHTPKIMRPSLLCACCLTSIMQEIVSVTYNIPQLLWQLHD